MDSTRFVLRAERPTDRYVRAPRARRTAGPPHRRPSVLRDGSCRERRRPVRALVRSACRGATAAIVFARAPPPRRRGTCVGSQPDQRTAWEMPCRALPCATGGTDGSNPLPSSGESANPRSLTRDWPIPSAGVYAFTRAPLARLLREEDATRSALADRATFALDRD